MSQGKITELLALMTKSWEGSGTPDLRSEKTQVWIPHRPQLPHPTMFQSIFLLAGCLFDKPFDAHSSSDRPSTYFSPETIRPTVSECGSLKDPVGSQEIIQILSLLHPKWESWTLDGDRHCQNGPHEEKTGSMTVKQKKKSHTHGIGLIWSGTGTELPGFLMDAITGKMVFTASCWEAYHYLAISIFNKFCGFPGVAGHYIWVFRLSCIGMQEALCGCR